MLKRKYQSKNTSKYLIRLDDACNTMPAEKWDILEDFFEYYDIRPLVAVIPDNQDKSMKYEDEDPMFWSRVRRWQDKGWAIAMHGYQHQMHYTDARLILPFYKRSEFAGLSLEEQASKIRKSFQIFQSNKINPTVWIAPAHSFDEITISAIRKETDIKIISDGFAIDQFYLHKMYWLPQQLWQYEEKKSGFWTICLHPNSMSINDLEEFKNTIKRHALDRISSVDNINFIKRKLNIFDRILNLRFWSKYKFFKILSSLRN